MLLQFTSLFYVVAWRWDFDGERDGGGKAAEIATAAAM